MPGWLANLESRSFLLFYLLCRYRFRHFDQNRIRRYQERRLQAQARHAAARSPFFRNLYAGLDLRQVWSLPTVNKKIMMEHLGEYNTLGFSREELLDFCLEVERTRDFSRRLKGVNVGMSSGTSGNKGVEIVTPAEERWMKAALFARFPFPKGEKVNLAFILRVSAPAFSLGILGHRLTYISQLEPLAQLREKLARLQPNVISAPPSMLRIIAREREQGRLDVHPKEVVSYAEILYPDVKEYLARIFGCPVYEIYKCTEGAIALACRHGSLHINEDIIAVETLEADGSQTPPGQPCKRLIITDLHKRSQPIIRYELNDIITISPDRCPCGSAFRVISNIQGRSDDLFLARNRETGAWQEIFPDYISRAIISASDDIEEYQVIQEQPNRVLARLELKAGLDPVAFDSKPVTASLLAVFERYGCEPPEVRIEYGKPEVNPNSLKLIRIHRNFKPE